MEHTTRLLLLDRRRIPPENLLLYLGRPNLDAADVPIGDDTELGDDTIIRWMFLLPADADIRSATGWVSGVGNIFYDAAGDPVAVLASEIAAWSSINQWNVLFHLVSAETETGRLAIYAVDTPLVILNKALRVLREDQIDVSPSAFFNGMDTTGKTSYTGGPTYAPDHLGVLRTPGANLPAIEGMRLATTVADGAVLGPELVVNGTFADATGWTISNIATIANGTATLTNNTSGISQSMTGVAGKTWRISYNVIRKTYTGVLFIDQAWAAFRTIPFAVGPQEVTIVLAANVTELTLRLGGGFTYTGDVEIDNISVQELIPTWRDTTITGEPILPSVNQATRTGNTDFTEFIAGTTFKKYTRTNPATDMPGYLSEPARTNKCTCRKCNPVDTSGLTKSGDAAAILSVVDDTAALTAAGLIGLCNSGKVYKLDNSLGTGAAWIACGGITVNTNKHSSLAYIRGGSGSIMAGDISDLTPFTTNETYSVIKAENFTPLAGTDKLFIKAYSGQVVYFILPQLEEGPFCTSPICKLADGTDPLTAITRAGTVLTYPTAGKIRSNNMAFRMIVVPRAGGQATAYLFRLVNGATDLKIRISPTSIVFGKWDGAVDTLASVNTTHSVGVPLYIVATMSSKGMSIAVRQYSAGWGSWSNNTITSATSKTGFTTPTLFQVGSLNSQYQFTGNISELDTLFIPEGITDPLAWAKAQWGLPA